MNVLLSLFFSANSWALLDFVPIGAIAVLLLLSALISGSEVAFFSLSPADLQNLESARDQEQSVKAQRVLELLEKPDSVRGPRHLLATILVLNNVINIVIILISTLVMERFFPSSEMEEWMKWTLHIGAVTFLILLFGEVIPKVYSSTNRVQFAQFMAGPLIIARSILSPVWRPLVKLGGWVKCPL